MILTDEKWWGDFRMMNEGGVITSDQAGFVVIARDKE